MKRGWLIILLCIFLICNVSAITSNFDSSYAPRQTAIVDLGEGIIEPIKDYQVKFKRGTVEIAVPFDVEKIGRNYYLWFIAPNNEESYSITFSDVLTTVNGFPSVDDFVANFDVAGESVDYSIEPGIISANDDFEIIARNYKGGSISIEVDFPTARTVNLIPGENTISFSLDGVYGIQEISIQVGQYFVPSYIIGENMPVNESGGEQNETGDDKNKSVEGNDTLVNETENGGEINDSEKLSDVEFGIEPGIIEGSFLYNGEMRTYPVRIINKGKARIDKIVFQFNDGVFYMQPEVVNNISMNESVTINMTVHNLTLNSIRDVISAKSGNKTEYLIVKLQATNNESDVKTTFLRDDPGSGDILFYCSELAGLTCSSGEVCDGESVASIEGECCIGSCIEESGEGSLAWLGWVILGIVILVVLIMFVKYRQTKTKTTGNPVTSAVASAEKKIP